MILKPPKGAMLNRGHPLSKGLVGLWLMNEGGGTIVNDLSGNGNTGSLAAAFADPAWSAGRFGPCLEFDATDQVDAGQKSSIKPTGAMSLGYWAKAASGIAAGAGVGTMGASGYRGYMFTFYGADISAYVAVNTTTLFGTSASGHVGTVWTHYMMVFSPSNYIRIYRNGVLIAANTTSPPAVQYQANGKSLHFGDRGDDSGSFVGLLDNVQIYNRALSATEILNLYRSPFCMFEVDL